MITRPLQAGFIVALPSGNRVILLRREGREWVCEYMPGSSLRGETEFSSGFLRTHGKLTVC